MDKERFGELFQEAIRRALKLADLFPTTTKPLVEFYGKPNPRNPITMEQALDHLWLSPDRFYRVVDVAAFLGENDPPVIFVRPAGFDPEPFSETYNPNDLGPFQAMGPAMRGKNSYVGR
jgi:hypothetical protein